MKYALLLIVFSASFSSCCKGPVDISKNPNPYAGRPQPYTGVATATKDGKPWKADVYAFGRDTGSHTDRFKLFFDNYGTFEAGSARVDQISFAMLQKKSYRVVPASVFLHGIGTNYAVDSLESIDFTVSEVDVQLDLLEAVPSGHTFLEIQSFNPATNEFSGRFEFDFISEHPNKDTIRFRDGVFSGKVYPNYYSK